MNWYIVDKTVIHLAWQTCHDLDVANISVRSCCYFMSYCYTRRNSQPSVALGLESDPYDVYYAQ